MSTATHSPAKQPSKSLKETFIKAYELMCKARAMSDLYEANKEVTAKYVHASSRGHEAIQLAMAMQLKACDYIFPYYRDDSILLGIGMEPYELMLQLLAKRDDPFSGGRTYYSHPSLRRDGMPKIPHNSSATGMQAIPSAGVAMGIQYMEQRSLLPEDEAPISVCSIGDAAMTEGEVSEALQMAALRQLPIIFLVQDNEWDISANAREVRANDAAWYARGFKGLEVLSIEGNDFQACWESCEKALHMAREQRKPVLLHARVPLLGHHTSGVRKEWYRDDLEEHEARDPLPRFRQALEGMGYTAEELESVWKKCEEEVSAAYAKALKAEDPRPEDLFTHDFAPSPITEERGQRHPEGAETTLMVDCALFAVQEILEDHPEALLYGQDVGGRLGGVFREAATLAQKFGDDRVFNTPIMEAFIIGSTVGMAAVGAKPIVEVQFADYIWPGLNQLFTELSRSYYLSNGKWPASAVIRVPIGAYGSGGPYHSSSVESVLASIRGIKVLYPSNGADMKGLMKAAFYDPNPVVILEHKGLYWSKIKGTAGAKSPLPDRDYAVPIGKARIEQEARQEEVQSGRSMLVITYGMGVYWSLSASKNFEGRVEILDLRSISPLDEEAMIASAKKHGRVLIVSEEASGSPFAKSLAGIVQGGAFEYLDAPVALVASEDMPAIPLNSTLEETMIPNAEKVGAAMQELLDY